MASSPGSTRRDEIAALLRIKHQVVHTEYRLTTTTADIYYIDDSNHMFPRPIAVEAKDWERPLTSSNIAKIISLYRPSLDKREIVYLWIVGNHPLSSSPALSIRSLSNVCYFTMEELRASLMNFTPLMRDNILAFEHHEASTNFIDARIKGESKSLESAVMEITGT
jgi:hypothetical protein